MDRTKELRHMFAYVDKAADAIDQEKHAIRFVISTDQVDRDRESVEVNAIANAIKAFADNPVALACHQHRLSDGTPPVVGSWDTETFTAKKHHSEMVLNFAVDTRLGEQYWLLYSQRHMRAVSIGFRILDLKEEVTGGKRIYIITKIELYEISCVAVGANPKALAKAKELFGDQFGAEPDAAAKSVIEQATEKMSTIVEEALAPLADQLDDIKSLIVADQGEHGDALLGVSSDPLDPAGDGKSEQLATIAKSLTDLAERLEPKQS